MPTAAPAPCRAAALAATVAAVVLLAGLAPHPAHGTVPSRVLETDTGGVAGAEGDEVVLRPSALRTDGGTAEVEVVLGEDAPGDVVVELALAEPTVAADGTVTPGAPATGGRTTAGGRLQPGEVLLVTISEVDAPVVVVATIRPADDDGTSASTSLAAVVLPGPVGPAPTTDLQEVDGELRGTITASAPLLVTARLRGEQAVTHPDRLVLPGHEVALTGVPARWPLPSELAVTDEAGRSTTVATGGTALRVLALGLVAAAGLALALLARRRRRTPG